MNADDISPQIIGNLVYNNRIRTEVTKGINLNGYYTYMNGRFNYLAHNGCYWTSSMYDTDNAFAFGKLNELKSEIYPKLKSEECKVVPVIVAPKNNLNVQ